VYCGNDSSEKPGVRTKEERGLAAEIRRGGRSKKNKQVLDFIYLNKK